MRLLQLVDAFSRLGMQNMVRPNIHLLATLFLCVLETPDLPNRIVGRRVGFKAGFLQITKSLEKTIKKVFEQPPEQVSKKSRKSLSSKK